MPEEIELVLIRHGQTPGNAEKRYIGRTDESLSAEGRAELEERKARGVYPEAGNLYLSPLRRCIQTADILYPGQKFTVMDELREMEFGRFEGKNYAELSGDPDYQAWIDSGGVISFPGGEARADFIRRCLRGFRRILQLENEAPESGISKNRILENQTRRNQTRGNRIQENPARRNHIRTNRIPKNPPAGENIPAGRVSRKIEPPEDETAVTVPVPVLMPVHRICLIAHGGTIMALLSVLCGGDYWSYRVPNGGVFRVRLRPAAGNGGEDSTSGWKGENPVRMD